MPSCEICEERKPEEEFDEEARRSHLQWLPPQGCGFIGESAFADMRGLPTTQIKV